MITEVLLDFKPYLYAVPANSYKYLLSSFFNWFTRNAREYNSANHQS